MSDNSNVSNGFIDNPSWANLFEMAESYEEDDGMPA